MGGAFLDSTLDRLGDAAVFGGLVLLRRAGGSDACRALALYCLAMGPVALRLGPRRVAGMEARAGSPSARTGSSRSS